MKARRLEKNNSESKGNGEEDEDIENRYKIIVPDAVNRFPVWHFPPFNEFEISVLSLSLRE